MSRFKAQMQTIINQAEDELIRNYNDIQTSNQDAATRSMWGGIIGAVGLPLLVGALTGGVGLVAGSALAGIGSRVGREVGERTEGWSDVFDEGLDALALREGVTVEDIKSQGILSNFESELETDLSSQWDDFDQEQTVGAIKDAASAFILGGGMKALKGMSSAPAYVEGVNMAGEAVSGTTTALDPTIKDKMRYLLSQDFNIDPTNFIKGLQQGTQVDKTIPVAESPVVETTYVSTTPAAPTVFDEYEEVYYDDMFMDFDEDMFNDEVL